MYRYAKGLVMSPPKEGEDSYPKYAGERDEILASLKRRAITLVNGLNGLEGVSCQQAQGAMYAFPNITVGRCLLTPPDP